MQKTKIEWCDYTWNPIKGMCQYACPYCYARRIYRRFKWDSTPRLDEKELLAPYKLKKSSKIFVCSTHEIFGYWIPDAWIRKIFKVIEENPQHTFQVLTKAPQRLLDISYFESLRIPKNLWLGVTVVDNASFHRIYTLVGDAMNREYYPEAIWKSPYKKIRWVSFEPLLERIWIDDIREETLEKLDWIVIGGLTGSKRMNCKTNPEMKEWIDEIVSFARKYNIPVFIKDNAHYPEVIREFPVKYKFVEVKHEG